jgi:hypothetical protein
MYQVGEKHSSPSNAIWIRPRADSDSSSLGRNTLSRRAWCYQEEILAPRTLSFGQSQVAFECRETRRLETTPDLGIQRRIFDGNPKLKFTSQLRREDFTRDLWIEAMKLWHGMVISYSRRELSLAKDNYHQSQAWQLDLSLAQKIATLLAYGAVIFLADFAGKQAV